MIEVSEVLAIHEILIERFGGSKGIRDQAILESAVNRPFQTFDGMDLYPESVDKAAAIFESVISNHPFVDGNKRTAYTLMRLVLLNDQKDIIATEDEKYDFVIRCAQGQFSFEKIKAWITMKLK
ncbi:MAG TPA: Fic family protein [Cyclobacteriaceae bacterium]|nr:Fic family protein [Cyclobacteriaceae bacterium]